MGRKHILKEHQLEEEALLSGPITTEATHAENMDWIKYSLVWTGADAVDGTITLEVANDAEGRNFNAVELSETLLIDSAADSHEIYCDVDFKWARLVIGPESNTMGTIDVFVNGGTVGS